LDQFVSKEILRRTGTKFFLVNHYAAKEDCYR